MKSEVKIVVDSQISQYDPRLSGNALRLYTCLQSLHGTELDDLYGTIQEHAQISNPTFWRSWKELKQYGYLTPNKSNTGNRKKKWLTVKVCGSLLADSVVAMATTAKKD